MVGRPLHIAESVAGQTTIWHLVPVKGTRLYTHMSIAGGSHTCTSTPVPGSGLFVNRAAKGQYPCVGWFDSMWVGLEPKLAYPDFNVIELDQVKWDYHI